MLLDTRQTRVIEIEVTREDIRKAVRETSAGISASHCVIAQALMREFGGRWSVGPTSATGFEPWTRYSHDGERLVMLFDVMPGWISRLFLKPRTVRLAESR